MASMKSMLAASVLALPADAFVAPTSQQVSGLRGTAPSASGSASGSGIATFSMLAASGVSGAAMMSFARPSARKAKVVCNFSKEAQIGAMEPVGFFDPAGFCTDEAAFKDLRAKEIKHGRLAMMGALGMLTQSLVTLPGMEGVPKDVTAATVGNGQVGFLLTIGIIAVLEATVFVQDESKEPGNFGNPLPWFDDYSDEMRSRALEAFVMLFGIALRFLFAVLDYYLSLLFSVAAARIVFLVFVLGSAGKPSVNLEDGTFVVMC